MHVQTITMHYAFSKYVVASTTSPPLYYVHIMLSIKKSLGISYLFKFYLLKKLREFA